MIVVVVVVVVHIACPPGISVAVAYFRTGQAPTSEK